jgi:Protein of unknown function (DUF2721)
LDAGSFFFHSNSDEVAMLSTLTMDQLQVVISQAAAPAFILGAVASFLSVLLSHMNRVIDRYRLISDLDDPQKAPLKANLPHLQRRAAILHRAIYWAVGSGIVTCLLMIVAFASAYFGFRHEPGAAVLFMISLGLFTASLISFAREVGIALKHSEGG